ncbi:MAG: hypothetical protein K2K68_02280 [Duncaniella sp.]|nr:hypothetical protein [Duncaniella sp.]
MKRSLLSLLLWLAALTAINVSAENEYTPSPTGFKDLVNEPTFESGKFNHHIDCPVSYATGSFSLSIPLFSWDECGFPISLSLDYSPGIKAEDRAGIFGLGWSLGGLTGSISRQIIGLPDERQDFYLFNNKKNIRDYIREADTRDLIELARNIKDAYYDKFYYSITGYSGCFIFKNDTIYDLSGNDLDFGWVKGENKTPKTFTITTPEGWKYNFGVIANSSKHTRLIQINSHHVDTDYDVATQWGLTSVSLPDNASTIKVFSQGDSYTKEEESEFYYTNASSTQSDGTNGLRQIENVITTTRSGYAGISEIKASQAQITFSGWADSMTGIIKDRDGNVTRRIELTFDCKISGRKKLTSIAIYSGNELLDYKYFTYHNDSFSVERPWACADFFGYSNRNRPFYSDTTKVAYDKQNPGGVKDQMGKYYDETIKGGNYLYYINHNNPVTESIFKINGELNSQRFYNFNHACSASLKEMTDANGLITKIIYEPNVATMWYGRNNDSVNVNIGIRVAKIVTDDVISARHKERSFRYYDPIFSLPLNELRKRDFVSHAGIARSTNQNKMECSQTTTMTASCRRPGMCAENTVIYYGAVEETVTGTELDKAVKTRYEFDNNVSVNSKFGIDYSEILYNRRNIGSENAVYYLGYGIDGTVQNPLLGNNDILAGFSEVFGQKAPLLRCAKYEFDGKKGDFRLKEETVNVYTHSAQTVYQVGIYCEQLRRITYNKNGYYVNGGDKDDLATGIATVKSFRTYLDSTIIIKYFPDGSSRRIETRYVYPDRDLASVKNVFPDEESDIHAGKLHRPVGTIVKCAGTTIAKYDLLSDHISTYGALDTLNRTLPVISRTIINNSKEFSTYIHYKKFYSNLLPSRYETVGKDGEPVIDWLAVDSYNSRRQPLKVRRHASPTMVYTCLVYTSDAADE